MLDGSDLGANLALEISASHPELAGVVLESPLDRPAKAIFSDPRAHLVPAHLLVSDRFDLDAPAAALRIPSLWFLPEPPRGQSESPEGSRAFQRITAKKLWIGLTPSSQSHETISDALSRWLDDLHK